MARLVDKIKRYIADRRVQDVLPPEADIPHGLAPDLLPARPGPGQGPRAGAPLKGRVNSPNNRDRVLSRPEERTEELLALTEDALCDPDDDGFDPYNTGTFRTTGSWKRRSP